ncbi:hypothetical protein MPH_07514, partial [Macrophomina phaseolina MS6]
NPDLPRTRGRPRTRTTENPQERQNQEPDKNSRALENAEIVHQPQARRQNRQTQPPTAQQAPPTRDVAVLTRTDPHNSQGQTAPQQPRQPPTPSDPPLPTRQHQWHYILAQVPLNPSLRVTYAAFASDPVWLRPAKYATQRDVAVPPILSKKPTAHHKPTPPRHESALINDVIGSLGKVNKEKRRKKGLTSSHSHPLSIAHTKPTRNTLATTRRARPNSTNAVIQKTLKTETND